MLKEMGIKLAAFISGDRTRRGPLAKGLPTLEAHRDLPPYVQYHELTGKQVQAGETIIKLSK